MKYKHSFQKVRDSEVTVIKKSGLETGIFEDYMSA